MWCSRYVNIVGLFFHVIRFSVSLYFARHYNANSSAATLIKEFILSFRHFWCFFLCLALAPNGSVSNWADTRCSFSVIVCYFHQQCCPVLAFKFDFFICLPNKPRLRLWQLDKQWSPLGRFWLFYLIEFHLFLFFSPKYDVFRFLKDWVPDYSCTSNLSFVPELHRLSVLGFVDFLQLLLWLGRQHRLCY